jgi:DNA replication protein DnaC
MPGDKGTGKTYTSLAICEFYTRFRPHCVFITQERLMREWVDESTGTPSEIFKSVEKCELLVVDDFGTSEPTPKFMSYFFNLIDTRIQWTNRGTVINTNLDNEKFSKICGEPLMDRLSMGQIIKFKGKSKRKQINI